MSGEYAYGIPGAQFAVNEATSWRPCITEEIEDAGVSADLAAWAAEHRGHQLALQVGGLGRVRQVMCVRCKGEADRVTLTASLITARAAAEDQRNARLPWRRGEGVAQ